MIDFLEVLVPCFVLIIIWIITIKVWYQNNAKKCNYDCKKCKAFDCACKICGKLKKEK